MQARVAQQGEYSRSNGKVGGSSPPSGSMSNIINWKTAVNIVMGNDTYVSQKNLSSLVTYARKFGIGKEITFQKTEYQDIDLDNLKKLIRWWCYLNKVTYQELRDNITSFKIQKIISKAIANNNKIILYAIFCPSYIKGEGEIGYTGKTGENTKKKILNLERFVSKSINLGLKVSVNVYFSDIMLENYEKLKGTDYRVKLNKNFDDFKSYFSSNKFNFYKLSDFKQLNKSIGETGILSGKLHISKKIYIKLLNRNRVFYKNILGWKEKEITKRTKILIRSYQLLGLYFRKKYPEAIMYWVESSHERGIMYSIPILNNPIPIIYPK